MKKFGFMVVLFTSVLNMSLANAATTVCGADFLNIVAEHLKLQNFNLYTPETEEGVVVSAACKPSPQDGNVELVAIAYSLFDRKHPEKLVKERPELEYEKDAIVAMIDKTTHKIVSQYQL
jgi:hypothetical protein